MMYMIEVHDGYISGHSYFVCAFSGNASSSSLPLRLLMLTFHLKEVLYNNNYYYFLNIYFMLPKMFIKN